jgi:hypothetical protein
MSTIITKNSATSGSTPSSLVQGELAINVTDGKLFYGSGSGNVVREFTGSGGGGGTVNTGSFVTTSSFNAYTGSNTSQFAGTASYATNAISASYTPLTIGTTAITSGTDTRLLYQNAGVVSQSARMTFDGTKFIYDGTSATANASIFEILGTGGQRGLWVYQDNSAKIGGNNNYFVTKGTGTGQATNNFYSNDSHFCFGGVDSTKGWVHIGANNNNPQAKLDIRAQGALSTDIAFRVRNSANSANI